MSIQNSFVPRARYSFSQAHILTSSCFWASLTAPTRCSVVVALAVAIRFWMVSIDVWKLICSWCLMSQQFFNLFLCFSSSFLIFFLRNFCLLAWPYMYLCFLHVLTNFELHFLCFSCVWFFQIAVCFQLHLTKSLIQFLIPFLIEFIPRN